MSHGALVLGLVSCALLAVGTLLAALRLHSQQGAGTGYSQGGAVDGEQRGRAERFRVLGALLRPDSEEALHELRARTVRAGLYGRDAIDLFLTLRLIVIVAGAGVILFVASAFQRQPITAAALGLLVGGTALMGPNLWLRARAKARQAQIAAALPDTLDLLVVCLEAGLGLRQALDRVVHSGSADSGGTKLLSDELQLVLADMSVGMSVEQAFRRFATRIGSEETSAVAAVVVRGTVLGARMAELLRGHSDALRKRHLFELEEASGKANAKMALPLTLCLMPAALIVMVGPAFLALLKAL